MEVPYSEEELNQILKNKWANSVHSSYIQPKNCFLPQIYENVKKEIDEYEVMNSDIWICSFPRTGTTWTSEMVWLISNNCNYEKAKSLTTERIPFLDFGFITTSETNKLDPKYDSINYAKNQPSPRFIKTHLPFQLLPKQIQNAEKLPKIIYICRNPLDACISYYYFSLNLKFTGSLEDFCKLYISGKVLYGGFWDHVLPFWKLKDQPNVLFLKYEDMKRDLKKVIQQVAIFLDKPLSKEEIDSLEKYLSFESMQKNTAVNQRCSRFSKSPFIRSGKVEGYKTEMPQHFIEKFQKWMQQNLEGTGLNF